MKISNQSKLENFMHPMHQNKPDTQDWNTLLLSVLP